MWLHVLVIVTVPFVRMICLLIPATLIKWHLEIDIGWTMRGMMPHPELWLSIWFTVLLVVLRTLGYDALSGEYMLFMDYVTGRRRYGLSFLQGRV